MSATFGAASPPIDAPAGGYVHEHSVESSIEVAPLRDSNAVTVKFTAKPMVTGVANIKGAGDPVFSGVTAGAFTDDTFKVVEAKGSESNDDYPMFDITAEKFTNLA